MHDSKNNETTGYTQYSTYDALFVLDFDFNRLNGVRGFDVECDCLTR